ncbi:MAG: ribonuclease HI family protein [Elusimicrobia bacterium]|nr:ribonuclease HI family protein [Elusimicrobiota bacterium]
MKLRVFVDGASRGNPGPSSVGVVIQDDLGRTVREHCRRIGQTTNNVAEYAALLDALEIGRELGGTEILIHSDSQLLVRQLSGAYRVKNPRLQGYFSRIQLLLREFAAAEFVHVPREQNKRADKLANAALDAEE